MNIEAFMVCDAATDQMGKLNILGAFDSIFSQKFPAVHPACAVALRIRFAFMEKGDHRIEIHWMDDDGVEIIPPLVGGIQVSFANNESSVVSNFILNLQKVPFPHPGDYSVNLDIDGEEKAMLPILVRQARPYSSDPG